MARNPLYDGAYLDDPPTYSGIEQPNSQVAYSKRKVNALDIFGHSYTTTGYSHANYSWWAALGRMLGVAPTSFGISGSKLLMGNGVAQGGYAAVLQSVSPLVTRNFANKAFFPNVGVIATTYGLNDVGDASTNNGADIAKILASWGNCLRAVIDHFSSSGLYQSEDATYLTLGGAGWATFASTNQNSGAGYSQNSNTGATVTCTIPITYVGGIVGLGFVNNRVGGATPGSLVTFTVDGVPTAPVGYTLANFNTTNVNPAGIATQSAMVARFNLSAGAHVIIATCGVGGVAFDRLNIQSVPPKPVLWGGIARTPLATDITLSSTAAVNALTQQILRDEFSQYAVRYVDIDSVLRKDDNLFADGTHPNDLGHALIAEEFAQEWAKMPILPGMLATA